MGNGNSGGFEIDVESMKKQIRDRLRPAVQHFEACAKDLRSLESHSIGEATSAEGRGGISSAFATSFDAQIVELIEQRDKAVRTLSDFTDALDAVVKYYERQDGRHANTLRSIGGDI